MNRDSLLTAAVQATGLTDFGEDHWQEGFDRLLDSLAGEARLHELGTAVVTNELVGLLSNRLRLTDWRRRNPAVERGTVTAPVVIVGPPRTGTTILHDLLAQDPAFRAPLTWEVDRPYPPPTAADYHNDPRIDEAQAAIDAANALMPGLDGHHPTGARLAQECVRITAGDFRSMTFTAQYRVPGYTRWLLDEADMSSAYDWHRNYLQYLQSRCPAPRWLLKAPAHLWHLDALLTRYPDAVLVHTHRDIPRVLASVSALVALLRRASSAPTSVSEVAAEYTDYIFKALDRSLAARRSGLVVPSRVIDVKYTDFVADPIAVIRGIYDRLGTELHPATEQRMCDFLIAHPGQDGEGTRYTFAETGLDAAKLRDRAHAYQDYFDVPAEPLADTPTSWHARIAARHRSRV